MTRWLATIACVACMATVQTWAGTALFDFETEDEIGIWHNEGATVLGADKKLERSESFAASGKYSMRFFTPAWRLAEHGGASHWPAFECKPPITDWSRFDRLIFNVINTTEAPQRLMLFISDSNIATRRGLSHREFIPPRSHVQALIDLKEGFAARKVDAADIHVMHVFTENPPVDMTVHIDRLLLLEPGEEPPPLPASYLREIAALQSGAFDDLDASLAAAGERMKRAAGQSADVLAWVSEEIAGLQTRLAGIRSRLNRPDESVLVAPSELARVQDDLARLEGLLALRLQFGAIRESVQTPTQAGDHVVVGFATSMEKVLPRAGIPSLQITARPTAALARNETESIQVAVMPVRGGLKGVRVRVGELRTQDGKTLAADNIEAAPVGYVETKATPPYGSSHVGWWPDPILGFMDAVDIAKGDVQTFWLRIRAPKEQAPGVYEGKLQVLSDGAALFSFELAVRVYGFTMPDASPLPLAITFSPHDNAQPAERSEWRESEDYPVNAWRRHKSEWVDFLADYYLTYDSLYEYGGWAPDFDELKRLDEQGRLGVFNLGYFSKMNEGDEAAAAWRAATIGRLKPRYEKAKELGLLDHAYIYGCDEHPEALFPAVQRAAAALKAEFPDVPVLTTTYDNSFGEESVIQSADAFCPLTPRFDTARVEAVRQKGKEVWWYICCGPRHPFANMFVEYPAIEGRLLMGAMTAKYRPDGFLYYQISIWNSQKPITDGPFTDWDPRSWTTFHGDGSWTCVGPDGTPLPTVRLENFRDGLEDYAYFRILEATVARVQGSPQLRAEREEWLADANALLQVPTDLVKSLFEYTRDPSLVYRYRADLADAIESAGISPADPWAQDQ